MQLFTLYFLKPTQSSATFALVLFKDKAATGIHQATLSYPAVRRSALAGIYLAHHP